MTTFLAWVETTIGTGYKGSGTGYVLVLAEDSEEAKKKVALHYEKKFHDEVIHKIRIGITIQ